LGLLWFLYSQWKSEEVSPEDSRQATKSAPRRSQDSRSQAAAEASPSQPAYAYTRLGLWVASSATPTPPIQEASHAAPSPAVSEGASPSASPDLDHETETSKAVQNPNVKSTPETSPTISSQPAPVVEAASPTEKVESAGEDSGAEKLARSNPRPVATPLATPAVDSQEAQAQNSSTPASEEEFLKNLVRDYMQTVASDDASAQERFFSWRVNFYGKGLLSLPEARVSMARYQQEWPIRIWTPRGEPEYPKVLHSTHPELYEVLQPFDWTVANGAHHKNGSATLYVRVRKDDKGQFHIIHLEQRRAGDQPENVPE
jgi:hypothetical protein